jgi:hypothetical protein
MACKKSKLKPDEVVSVWFGKGHMPVRGKVCGFTPKYIKAWVKESGSNTYKREDGCGIDNPPKVFYLTEEQITKIKNNYKDIYKKTGILEF